MPILSVPLHLGLVTSKDPSLLAVGECSELTNSYYKPNDPGVWKIPGRKAFNSTALSSAIVGARYLEFDGATDLILAMSGTVYYTATAALTGTFASLVTGLAGTATSLDTTHYNNSHFAMNGVDRNREITSSGTANFHGLLANTEAPTVSRDAGAGTGFTLTSGNTVVYWVEERVKSGSTVQRRNATTFTVTLTGDGTLDKPVVTRPTAVNSDATHWALYATATNGTFPTGAEISEVAIATTTIEDTRTGTDPSLPSGDGYETVSISFAGVTQNVARNGPPPIADTGDVFEDSIACNDVSDRSHLRYSFPDVPHAFPSVNFIRFETKEADEIKLIRSLGRILVVCMRDTAWRVETLPRPEDASFVIDRVKGLIHGAHGAVGPKAAAVFSFGQGPRLAYVSRYGIVVTDGYTWDTIEDDLDWEGRVSIGGLSSSALVNNPRYYRLEHYYISRSGTRQCDYYHYHPSHAKQAQGGGFRGKVSGPITAASVSDAFVANITGEHHSMTCGTDGVIYVEGQGVTDGANSNAALTMSVATTELHAAGPWDEFKINDVGLHHNAAPSGEAVVTLTMRGEGESDTTTPATVSLALRETTTTGLQGQAESVILGASTSSNQAELRLDYFLVDTDDLGRSET